jgi:hypothetical protein
MAWIISDLHIQGVKGVLDRSGDFKLASKRTPRSLVIFAPNGCGKSGYADAIEYLFSEDGGIDHLGKGSADSERGGKHAIPHVLAEERGISPEVSITLFNTETEERIPVTRPVNIGRTDNRPTDLDRILRLAPAHRVLRQHDLRRFVVEMTPGDKYSELSRWIGLTPLETILRHLETTLNELNKVDLNREVAERQKDILLNTDGAVTSTSEVEILQWCQNKVTEFSDSETAVTSRDELNLAINVLESIREKKILESSASDAYQAKQYLENELPKTLQTEGHIGKSLSAFGLSMIAEQAVSQLRKSVQTSIFKQTWEATQELLNSGPIQECPICKTEWEKTKITSQTEALLQIRANLNELSSLKKAEEDQRTAAVALQTSTSLIIKVLEGIASNLNSLAITKYQDDLQEIINIITQINASPYIVEGLHNPFLDAIDCLKALVPDAILSVQKIEIKGIPEEAQAVEQVTTKFKNLLSTLARLDELECEQQEQLKVKQSFTLIADAIREQSARLVNGIVDAFRADVLSIYRAIHPTGAVPNIHISPDVDKRTLGLRIDFHNEGRTLPPAGYLSESFINSLGLALFIGSVRLFNQRFPFIFFDDIVSSYDADHRARIVDVIAEQLVNFQVMLTTHDQRFYTMLRDRLSDQGWLFERVASWDFEHGPVRETDSLRQDEVESLIRQGNPTIAGNAVRQYMEDWLDKLCARFEAYTLHKRGNKDYDRTLFDFWGPFISRLEKVKGDFFQKQIASQQCYDRLKTHGLLNYYSHAQANPYEWPSMGDVEYAWVEFQVFQNRFYCMSCNKLLQYHHNENRLYCTCGGQVFQNP